MHRLASLQIGHHLFTSSVSLKGPVGNMSAAGNIVKAVVGSVGIIGFGYVVMRATTPSDAQFYDALSPELKKQVDAQRQAAARKAAYAEQLSQAKQSESADAPRWAAAEAKKARDSTPPQ